MVTLADLLYLGLFALILPLLDYAFFWPAFRRRAEADSARAKRWLYAWSIPSAWAMVAFGATIWVFHDRPWAALGFSAPLGWRLWVATALVVLLFAYLAYAVSTLVRDAAARASVRRQMESVSAMVPSTQADLYGFLGVSLTAGFCEEFLFRGYLIWALSPWLGWWGGCGVVSCAFCKLACLPRLECCDPHGGYGRALHVGAGSVRLPMAGHCFARACRFRLRAHGVACVARARGSGLISLKNAMKTGAAPALSTA